MNWLVKISQRKPMPLEDYEFSADLLQDYDDYYSPEKYEDFEYPDNLVAIDIQPAFNKSISFEGQELLSFLKGCINHGTSFHVVYDMLENEPPEFLANLPGVRVYEKAYGADPYYETGVIDREVQVDTSSIDHLLHNNNPEAISAYKHYYNELRKEQSQIQPEDMEFGKLYYDPYARMDIFKSIGHEYQHVYEDMVTLVDNLKGQEVAVIGGAEHECMADMLTWFDMNGIKYNLMRRFVY